MITSVMRTFEAFQLFKIKKIKEKNNKQTTFGFVRNTTIISINENTCDYPTLGLNGCVVKRLMLERTQQF